MLQGFSSSPVDRRFSKNHRVPSLHSKRFLQLNDRLHPFLSQGASSAVSSRTSRGSIYAEIGRQSWDFGRFVRTLYFFNGPPSPAKVSELGSFSFSSLFFRVFL